MASELDILSLMQATGFPPAALAAKRQAIAACEFDNADDKTKVAITNAIDEQALQDVQEPANTDPNLGA